MKIIPNKWVYVNICWELQKVTLLMIKLATPSAAQLTRRSFTLLPQLCPHCLEVKHKFPFACQAGGEPVSVTL